MSHLLVALLLTAADGGFEPKVWNLEGGVVCMDEPTAVYNARRIVTAETEAAKDKAALEKSDPSPVKVALWTLAGLLVGGAVAGGAICATGHCK